MVINNCICTAVYVSNFFRIVSVLTLFFCLHLFVIPQLQEEETHILQDTPSQPTDDNPVCVGKPFIFPHTRSRPPLLPSMPTLPEEEEDSPEEMDSSSSSPTTVSTKADVVWNEKSHHSTGNVIDLVKDPIPEVQLSEEDRLKNLDLLEQAKRVSDRFLTRRGRRSSSSLTESPTGLSPPTTPSSSPNSSRSSSVTVEHKLMRNQSMAGSKLADLSEASEQEKGPMLSPTSVSAEAKERSDAMPNISDVMLRKLKLHRGLPGCAPPLTEKEVENAFVQLSLAFRNDNYTLETRMKQAERERNLTEEDTEKELEEFKRMTAPQWQNLEQREAYQRLVETVTVLKRLATRLSSRAEIVGAVRQEKRMNKATEVMMQYVENLKRTYEKDHAELTEFKKLANQNSNRCYGGNCTRLYQNVS
uniref:Murine retrovirus integration site 1 homolog n=1 Tax=Cynoglossus semilaevis TaxID=244447 RepID=A0A3P8WSI4_CYNSE